MPCVCQYSSIPVGLPRGAKRITGVIYRRCCGGGFLGRCHRCTWLGGCLTPVTRALRTSEPTGMCRDSSGFVRFVDVCKAGHAFKRMPQEVRNHFVADTLVYGGGCKIMLVFRLHVKGTLVLLCSCRTCVSARQRPSSYHVGSLKLKVYEICYNLALIRSTRSATIWL